MQRSIRKFGIWLCVFPALASSLSWAVPAPSNLDIQFWVGNTMSEWTPTILGSGDSHWLNNTTNSVAGATISWYNTTVNFDPFISSSVDVVNTSGSVQNYTFIFTLPISPAITSGSLIGGSTQGGLTDANFDGTGTLSTLPGQPLYYGEIDGVDVLPLFPDLTTLTVPFA